MLQLFNEAGSECSKVITTKYSTSFSLGIKAFDKKFHNPIYAIYGFVRLGDEIVDTFHDFDQEKLLSDFRVETFAAIANKISLNPVLHSFQQVVNNCQIESGLIEAFLDSMKMDLTGKEHDAESYNRYIYGSAEVVGLMCLRVFCENDEGLYNELQGNARSLGSAFQKINFLRDIRSDYEERGRFYFPGLNFECFDDAAKKRIEREIEHEFKLGLAGIRGLPRGVRKGVYVAYVYYYELFKKIKKLAPGTIAKKRIRVSDKRKVWLLAQALVKNTLRVF